MNKKFSTLLTMGLLATSSLCGSAWAQTAPTINGIELEKVAAPANNAAWTGGPYCWLLMRMVRLKALIFCCKQ